MWWKSKYTIDDLEKDIEDINTELSMMRKAKGHDYSGEEDTFDNLREFGSLGVLVRLVDKIRRLIHFFEQAPLFVKDESIEDTMKDLINYAYFLKIIYQQEKESGVRFWLKKDKV